MQLKLAWISVMTISYHDYREDFYHAFLAGIFAGARYVVESNREHGEGRSDVIVFDLHGGRIARQNNSNIIPQIIILQIIIICGIIILSIILKIQGYSFNTVHTF